MTLGSNQGKWESGYSVRQMVAEKHRFNSAGGKKSFRNEITKGPGRAQLIVGGSIDPTVV